ncbi:MAG: class I SAM-dependent methyltransferase [Acidobacteria bacterium]|nr:class I SAM-dependent methyltransferase [Acidobacteriota bacterium]
MRAILGLLPSPLRRQVLHFEARIEEAVAAFAAGLPPQAIILDAGAGEGAYKSYFPAQRYIGVDLGIGDAAWNYRGLDALADLEALPFRDAAFDASINVVTLEHVRRPATVLAELRRVLKPGGRLLLIVPHEWEVHQPPNDYFRFTRYGVAHLARQAGFEVVRCDAAGGYFRLVSRRLLGGGQFFPMPLSLLWLAAVAIPALLLPLLDGLDKDKNFTLGYIAELHVASQ